MAGPLFVDRVLEKSNATGTGAYPLAGSPPGYQTFAAIGNGNTCYYAALEVDANGNPSGGWEIGLGTYTAAGPFLSRDTIIASSNNGAAVAWSGTQLYIFNDWPALKIANLTYQNAQNVFTVSPQKITTNGAAQFQLIDTSRPADGRLFEIMNANGVLYLQAANDAYTVSQGLVTIDRAGVLNANAGLGTTPLNASNLASGTVPPQRIGGDLNVNSLTAADTVTATTALRADGGAGQVSMNMPTAGVGNKCWRFVNYGDGLLRLEALTDGFAAVQKTFGFDKAGNLTVPTKPYERGRSQAMGEWYDALYNPANFTADGSTWNTGNAFAAHCYCLVGDTMWYTVHLTSAASNLTVQAQVLRIVNPLGYYTKRPSSGTGVISGGTMAWEPVMVYANQGANTVIIHRFLPIGTAGAGGGLGIIPAGGFTLNLTIAWNVIVPVLLEREDDLLPDVAQPRE